MMAYISVLCFLSLLVSGCQSTASDCVTLEKVQELIAQATTPLLDHVTELKDQVAAFNRQEEAHRLLVKQLEIRLARTESKTEKLETQLESLLRTNSHCCQSSEHMDDVTKKTDTNETVSGNGPSLNSSSTKDDTKRSKNVLGHKRIEGSNWKPLSGPKKAVKRFLAVETPIAFSAQMLRRNTPLHINQDVVFDTVVTNLGGAYNSVHGLFIAPSNGLYLFSASLMTSPGNNAECGITVNGHFKTRIYAHGTNAFDQGSQTVVLQLSQGDDVSLRVTFHDNANLYGDLYSSFTGVLLVDTPK